MKRLIIVAAIAVIAAPAFAGSDVFPIDGVKYMNYNAATGEMTQATPETRRVGATIWGVGEPIGLGYFWGQSYDTGDAGGDWGDIAIGSVVGGMEFSSFMNSMDQDGDVWVLILYYEEDNGFGDAGKVYTAGIIIDNVPANNHGPSQYWGYIWRVELDSANPIILDGSDLDGDGLGDFGYWMFCSGRTPGGLHGPGIWDRALVDPNALPPEAPGVEDAIDAYADPNYNTGVLAANIDPNNVNAAYTGSGTFTNAWGQVHQVLFAPVCPNRGDAGRYCQGDIAVPPDCIVGLADLGALLSNYGCTSDPNGPDVCTLAMGDIDPYDEWFPGDGDVDLSDLGEMLFQYGDDCNWP
jgi:hypothetical protein